jgi:hypothetical protein
MPINRRAIIHIGGKKELKNRQVLKLKNTNNQIFKNVGNKKSISFIVDPNAKQKKTKISNLIDAEDIRKYKIKDTHVNVNQFKYYDDEQMEKKEKDEQKAAEKMEAEELEKITKSIKEKFSKDNKLKNERKEMGMGTLLQDLKFPMKYYQNIQKEFDEFEKEFFFESNDEIRPEEKLNILRFKLRDDYKLASSHDMNLQLSNINKSPNEFFNKWDKLNKLSPNDSFIKKIMHKNFDQILKDIDRNLGSFVKTASKGFHEYDFSHSKDEFWKTPFYFYTAQLALFSQYYFLKHSNIDEWFVDFNGGALKRDDPDGKEIKDSLKKTIYNAVINGKIKGINHSFIKKFAATKMKIPWENIDHIATYVQSDLNMFIKTIQSTSNINKKEFNIIDAAALHIHIFFKQKLRTFFHNNVEIKDKKYCLKYACKMMTMANFIDPYLFTEFWDYINNKWNTFYDRDAEKWKSTGYPSIDTIKLGQLHMNHQKYKKFNPLRKWIDSEKNKFNVFRKKDEDPFTLTEIINKIENMESPNSHHEAFLNVSKKNKTDTLNYHVDGDTGKVSLYFDDNRTKMSWWYQFVQISISEWSHASGLLSIDQEFNGTNENSRLYMKYLYKYGIDGCILFNLIHFKNIRTSINLNKKNPIHNLKELVDFDKYNKIPDVYNPTKEKVSFMNDLQFKTNNHWNHSIGDFNKTVCLQQLSEGLASGFYLSGRKPSVPYDLKKSLDKQQANISEHKRATLVIDTPNNPYWNKYLNPLTCNLEETYGKHFDYCIEQIEKQHGSFKNFNEKFDQLFSSSLILYKNGFMDEHRLKEIEKNNPGITIVNKITDIWETYKDDERIYFPKNSDIDDNTLSHIEGFLGKFENNTLQHALDGIYHVDYNSFMKKANNLLVPFVPVSLLRKKNRNIFSKDFEWKDDGRILYDAEKTKLLWPRNSGRPFIFINKYKFLYTDGKKVGDKGKLKINKKIYKTNEIADKIKNATFIGTTKDKKIGKAIPDYWFDREYPFTNKDIITHIKLKTFLDSGYDKYKIIVKDINQKLLEGGIIDSLPEEVEVSIPETEEPEDDGSELVKPEDYGELVKPGEVGGKAGEIILDQKTQEEEEEAERLAKIESDRQADGVRDTAKAIDTLGNKMDEILDDPKCDELDINHNVEFIIKLLNTNSEMTDEKIIEEFKKRQNFGGTTDITIKCMISAARSWLPDTDVAVIKESEDGGDIKTQALKRLGLERVKIKDDGDCLFASLLMILDNEKNPDKDVIMQFRGKIIDYITGNVKKKRHLNRDVPEGEENTFWDVHGNGILSTPRPGQISGTRQSHAMYKNKNEYKTEMMLTEPNTANPRSRFGGTIEIIAFQELFESKLGGKKVQIIRWNEVTEKWDVWFPPGKPFDQENPTIIFEGLHYDFAKRITKSTQGGGGNNVHINKCKNHRHKRTRKFRIRFKNVGGWVHLNKPKKKTRRRY